MARPLLISFHRFCSFAAFAHCMFDERFPSFVVRFRQRRMHMDRNECIKALTVAGMSWAAATRLFDDQIVSRPDSERRFSVEHFALLASEASRLRKEV